MAKPCTERRVPVGRRNEWNVRQGRARSSLPELLPFSFCSKCIQVECGSILSNDRSAYSWTPAKKSAKLRFSQSEVLLSGITKLGAVWFAHHALAKICLPA